MQPEGDREIQSLVAQWTRDEVSFFEAMNRLLSVLDSDDRWEVAPLLQMLPPSLRADTADHFAVLASTPYEAIRLVSSNGVTGPSFGPSVHRRLRQYAGA